MTELRSARSPYEGGLEPGSIYVFDAAGRQTDVISNAFNGDLNGDGQVQPALSLDLDRDGAADYRIEVDPNQPEYNSITHTVYDAAGHTIEVVTNYWPGQPAYHLNLYNLSSRTYYDDAGRPVATIRNFTPADLAQGCAAWNFDGEADATLEVSPCQV
jgi:hypothetical protein